MHDDALLRAVQVQVQDSHRLCDEAIGSIGTNALIANAWHANFTGGSSIVLDPTNQSLGINTQPSRDHEDVGGGDGLTPVLKVPHLFLAPSHPTPQFLLSHVRIVASSPQHRDDYASELGFLLLDLACLALIFPFRGHRYAPKIFRGRTIYIISFRGRFKGTCNGD
jgi:hypothetical protein